MMISLSIGRRSLQGDRGHSHHVTRVRDGAHGNFYLLPPPLSLFFLLLTPSSPCTTTPTPAHHQSPAPPAPTYQAGVDDLQGGAVANDDRGSHRRAMALGVLGGGGGGGGGGRGGEGSTVTEKKRVLGEGGWGGLRGDVGEVMDRQRPRFEREVRSGRRERRW